MKLLETLHMHWNVTCRRYTAILLWMSIAFVVLLVAETVVVLVAHSGTTNPDTFVGGVATSMALMVALIAGLVKRMHELPDEFALAVSMGRTRLETLGCAALFTLGMFVVGYAYAWALSLAEPLVVHSIAPDANVEFRDPTITLEQGYSFSFGGPAPEELEMTNESLTRTIATTFPDDPLFVGNLESSGLVWDEMTQAWTLTHEGRSASLFLPQIAIIICLLMTVLALLCAGLVLRLPVRGTLVAVVLCLAVFLGATYVWGVATHDPAGLSTAAKTAMVAGALVLTGTATWGTFRLFTTYEG